VQRRGHSEAITFVSNDAESVLAVTNMFDPALAQRTIVLIDSEGNFRTGARAIFTIVSVTGGLLSVVARVLKPRPISIFFEPGYRVFARYRGKLARLFPDPG
jgi:predicted DCC family thiol-disulfide oxidoreductase YuxK